MAKKSKLSLMDWLCWRSDIIRDDTRWLGKIIGPLLSIIGLLLVILVIGILLQLCAAVFLTNAERDVRGITYALVAIIGAPFLAWRSIVAAKQADIADESLFNDKINAAAADLAARRQVSTVLGDGNEQTVITEWKDDLVTRAAAIDRLEGLAEERPDTAPRIARMLSIYVRQLSAEKEHSAKDHPRVDYLQLIENEGMSPEQAMTQLKIKSGEETVAHMQTWAQALEPVRSDMEKAAQTLGRLKRYAVDPEEIPIDLRGANLQGFDLFDLNFDGAQLQKARMEGADLRCAGMKGAYLRYARMEGADLINARMEGADLSDARMEGADLRDAGMERASLFDARMEGADLRDARMEGADLSGPRMEGANLSNARMEGAFLCYAQFGESTDFRAAVVQYAAVKSTPLLGIGVDQDMLNSLFGDDSVDLQDLEKPDHWADGDLDVSEFFERWDEWQRSQGYDPDAG